MKLQQLIDYTNIPGISFSWYKQGSVQSGAAGVVDTSAPSLVETSTLFQAASLSKAVSAAIVLDLVKKGHWDLDKPLCEISDYGSAEMQSNRYYQKLTTRMVLAQCSGLPNYSNHDKPTNFIAEPGTKFTYSGIAFDCLKETIEKKTGKEWEFIAQEFFCIIGMNHSTFLQPSACHLAGRKIARGHDGQGQPDPTIYPINSPAEPAGSLLTTSGDYIIFLRHCLSDQFLTTTLFKAHTQLIAADYPKTSAPVNKIQWGLGMGLFDHKIAFHWGTNPYSHAFAAVDIISGDCIACFVNSVNGPNVFQKITELVVGDMTPVFDLLSNYCGLNAVVKPTGPETQVNLLLFSNESQCVGNNQSDIEIITDKNIFNSVYPIGSSKQPNQK